VIQHGGAQSNGGHFIACVKDPRTQRWHRRNGPEVGRYTVRSHLLLVLMPPLVSLLPSPCSQVSDVPEDRFKDMVLNPPERSRYRAYMVSRPGANPSPHVVYQHLTQPPHTHTHCPMQLFYSMDTHTVPTADMPVVEPGVDPQGPTPLPHVPMDVAEADD
jgi:hypothetical protein